MAKKLNASKSKYNKNSLNETSGEEKFSEDEANNYSEDEANNYSENEANNYSEDEEEFDEVPDNVEEHLDEEPLPQPQHKRSRGLFKNYWWKKGLLKGFSVWLVLVVLFYIFDFLGMVDVIDWKRWFFFLLFLIVMGMAFEKFKFNKFI